MSQYGITNADGEVEFIVYYLGAQTGTYLLTVSVLQSNSPGTIQQVAQVQLKDTLYLTGETFEDLYNRLVNASMETLRLTILSDLAAGTEIGFRFQLPTRRPRFLFQ